MSEPKIEQGTPAAAGSGAEGWRIVAAYVDAGRPGWDVIDGDGDTVTWFSTYGLAAAYIEGVRLGWARRGEVGR